MRIMYWRIRHVVIQPIMQIAWAFQRVFRGWDDRVVWALDEYLADMMPMWIEKIKSGEGIPVVFFAGEDIPGFSWEVTASQEERANERYMRVLDEIADGFRAIRERYDSPENWDDLQSRIDWAMKLFAKYHYTLND